MEERVRDLVNSLLKAIDEEREEEKRLHTEEIKKLRPEEREKKGRCLIEMKKLKSKFVITGDFLYTFAKRNRAELPDMEISVGDQIIMSLYDPLDASNPTGVVYEMGKNYITIQSSYELPSAGTRPYRLDLFVNDLTYIRMKDALLKLKKPNQGFLCSVLAGNYIPGAKALGLEFEGLNEKQAAAVEYSLSSNGFYLIQGPPGTGKTFASASLIKALVDAGKKILISADSNAGVDNLIKKLVEKGVEPLRIGNPVRVNPELKQYSLDYKIVRHMLFGRIAEIEKEIADEKDRLQGLDKPAQKDMRGLKYSELMDLLERNVTARGISKRTLREMRPFVKTQVKIEKLRAEIKKIREEITASLLQEAGVIAATCSSSASEVLEGTYFDFCVLDEASQASIPSSLIPILKAHRFILVGDHFQLPPVVISEEAKKLGLSLSLMDVLAELYPYQLTMLEVQYRMNKRISELVSRSFYSSKLIADESVAHGRLKIKSQQSSLVNNREIEVLDLEGREYRLSETGSLYNPLEAEFCQKLIKAYLDSGIEEGAISLITPYRAQVDYLRARVKNIEIDTVDAFQGRENDLIILSLVRCNRQGELGFLKDWRRLNVSISRAKKKLIIVASKSTLIQDELYQKLFDRIEKGA